MRANADFIDATKAHTLTEDECTIISFYRAMNNTEKAVLSQHVFAFALQCNANREKRGKKKQDT